MTNILVYSTHYENFLEESNLWKDYNEQYKNLCVYERDLYDSLGTSKPHEDLLREYKKKMSVERQLRKVAAMLLDSLDSPTLKCIYDVLEVLKEFHKANAKVVRLEHELDEIDKTLLSSDYQLNSTSRSSEDHPRTILLHSPDQNNFRMRQLLRQGVQIWGTSFKMMTIGSPIGSLKKKIEIKTEIKYQTMYGIFYHTFMGSTRFHQTQN